MTYDTASLIKQTKQVDLITHACCAGKLAGSQIGGAQYGNEVNILSCQSNAYSIEGEQWGGGRRGAFIYHFTDMGWPVKTKTAG